MSNPALGYFSHAALKNIALYFVVCKNNQIPIRRAAGGLPINYDVVATVRYHCSKTFFFCRLTKICFTVIYCGCGELLNVVLLFLRLHFVWLGFEFVVLECDGTLSDHSRMETANRQTKRRTSSNKMEGWPGKQLVVYGRDLWPIVDALRSI